MRIKFLITGVMGLVLTTAAFAQKGELNNAQDEYGKYTVIRREPAMAAQATTNINNAKASIDKAAANPKTATLAQTYTIKGDVYAALALRETDPAASVPLFATAEDALKKAKETDTKGEFKKLIDEGMLDLVQYKLNEGIKNYQTQKYNAAYDDFLFYRNVRPDDTSAIYYTGLAAAAAQKYDDAIENYKKLVTTNYSRNPDVYADLSLIYLQKKDTLSALKIATEGADKYPGNNKLAKREIELNLQAGNKTKVLEKLEKAIANDPKNKTLYYYGGLAYSKTKDMTKAEAMYRKAIEIDPSYFEAYLNLGALLLQPGSQAYNAAQKIDVNKQKEYDAAMAKASAYFEVAKPVVLKTVELDPKSYDALYNLKVYYIGTKNMAEATATQKRIDALK